MKTFLLLIGIIVLAGLVVWSLAVLPDQSKQDKLGASIEQGISGLLQEEQGPPAPQEQAVELPKEGVIPVFLEPPQVKAGNKIKITVGAPDPASVRSIEIFLESPTGLQVSQTNIWNINGQGQWFDDVSIPQDAEPGTWKIKTIEITDTEGTITSYSYGTDIFSTFTVE